MGKEREPHSERFTLETVTAIAVENALRDGGVQPVLLIQGSKEGVGIQVQELAPTGEGRALQFFSIGFTIAGLRSIGNLEQVFFVSEAWMSAAQPDQPPTHPPSQDPNRIEVVIIFAHDVVKSESDAVMLEMIRNQRGDLTELRHLEKTQKGQGDRLESVLLDAFTEGFKLGNMKD